MKKELPVISVVLYITGALSAAFSVMSGYYIITDIVDSYLSGQLLLNTMSTIVNMISYCMWEFGIYLILALVLAGVGMAVQYAATNAALRGAEAPACCHDEDGHNDKEHDETPQDAGN